MTSIGIVGGGAAAVSLLRQLPYGESHEVCVYADRPLGPGRAYCENADSAILNRQVFAMSVSDSWPDEFHDWVRAHAPEWLDEDEHSFVPRSLYGRYLTDSADTAASHFGDRLTFVSGRVIDVAPHERRWRLTVDSGNGLPVEATHDVVVLALGSSPPADPYHLHGVASYTPDPYPTSGWIDDVAATRAAAVIGTGLSAVDVALAVRQRGWRGHLTMVSRHGILPDARAIVSPLDFDPDISALILRVTRKRGGLEWEDVLHIVDYLALGEGIRRSEVRAAFRAISQPAGDRLAEMAVATGSVDVAVQRLVIGIAQHYVNEIWAAMTRSARATFLTTTHAAFQALSNPLPAKSARRLGLMLSDGQLSIASGVREVDPGRTGFGMRFADGTRSSVEHAVNATRTPAGAPSPAAASLVSSLLYRGLAQRNPYGGLRVDVGTNALLDAAGGAVPGMYVIGEIASGDLYYISSMGKIRRRARSVARHIADESVTSNRSEATYV
ncbi:FAD/NAD(P)-binding protein [Williamsia maris]|uniref:NAD(P)/FAD-binding protein YdhS n=1 Tax=Williamsia maris TaxID=72806 RepID=A0ABT1H8J5_9NOCA|nr:FAD/NAD(P)-binding protein [Williamsia maris]MCP2174583.1 putative NAD(P)/FAD-binding protein YdhS [Williamsia maris]